MKNPFAEYIRLIKAIERAKREGRTDELLQKLKKNNEIQKEIQKAMMRPMRYETINGAGEIGWGTAMLCFALSSYISSGGAWMWRWRTGISCLLFVCAICAMPLCRWAIKKYVTRPRTGYVAFRRDGRFWIMMVVTVVVAVGVSIGLSRLMRPEMIQIAQSHMRHPGATNPGTSGFNGKIMLAGLGPLNAILYLMLNAVSIREHRWKWLLTVLIALGPLGICHVVPGNFIEVSRPVALFLGLVCFISGAATLFSFIRRHQPPAPEAE
jgi:hypothetical protein